MIDQSRSRQDVSFPTNCRVVSLEPPRYQGDCPSWTPYPEHLIGKRTLIAVPDRTRPFPVKDCLEAWLPGMRASLKAGGSVEILVGLGLHRKLNREELRGHVGEEVFHQFPVMNHDPTQCVTLGQTPDGCPISLHSRILEADEVLAVGTVEPHQYAGFSGGYKAISIGLAGLETISWLHSPACIDATGVAPGSVEGNPFRTQLRDIASVAPPLTVANGVVGPKGELIDFAVGDPESVIHRTTRTAWHCYGVTMPEKADLVVALVPGPKGVNLYQATRAFSGLVLPGRSLLKEGGTFLLCADCPEGIGLGKGETAFRHAMETPRKQLFSRKALAPGEQRAYVVGRLMERYTLMVCSPHADLSWQKLGVALVDDPQEALDSVQPKRCTWVPQGCSILLT